MTLGDNVTHLFNSTGTWIAFQKDEYIFDSAGNWIGWLPQNDGHAVDVEGNYLGTIVRDSSGHFRFYYFFDFSDRGYPGYPGYPGHPDHPGYPKFAGHSPLPPMARDIRLKVTV